ncbi:MAG TPA: DUF4340 domain-containing protein [Myxococcaceae bacterium]|nr:DUF4340 domain-containing protein [Myxococcaceae bacterium]
MRQTGKNLLLMAVMALLAAGLGLYAWLGVAKPGEREERRKQEEARLVSLGPPAAGARADAGAEQIEFSKITLQAKGETTVLEYQDGTWRMVAPVAAAVDSFAVDGLVSELRTGSVTGTIEENPSAEDLKRYGLDPPRIVVTAVARRKGGGEERDIQLEGGAENPFDGSIYLRRKGDPRVYAAQGGVRWNLEKSAYDLRDKQVLAVLDKDLQRVEVRAERNALVLERGDGDAWRITQPIADTADARVVSSFLNELRGQRATAFRADTPEERARTGVDKPAIAATFTPKQGEPIRFALGRISADAGQSYFVLRTQGAESILAEVPQSAFAALEKKPADLRDKSVLRFERDKVARIALGLGDKSRIVVERSGADAGTSDDWKILEPKPGPAKKFKLSSVLWMLESLQAKQIGEERPKSWAKYGTDAPEREVSLMDASGNVLARLVVGKKVPGQEGVRYARGSRDRVVEIEESRLSELPSSIDDLLDKPVASAGAPGAADGGGPLKQSSTQPR